MSVTKVNVLIRFSTLEKLVGQLVVDGSRVLFKYSDQYLSGGKNISPLKLKFDNTIQVAPPTPFDHLYGVFADSLPDAWGNLLLKRFLARNGKRNETLNTLERLTFVSDNGLGALVYQPTNSNEYFTSKDLDLDTLFADTQEVLKGESSDIIDRVFEHGGSPGGARPKIYADYNPKNDTLIYGNPILKEGYEHWIVKFAAGIDGSDSAQIEMAYYHMALDAGIKMNKCRLFTGLSGKTYFGTKRFDRIGSKQLHMISAAGLLHDDYEHSQLDYGILIQEGGQLTGSAVTHEQLLRRAAFNIFAHNRDDHSKNFAFLMNEVGEWNLSPAYDLTFSSSSQGQHSTTCAGNGNNPGDKELLSLANHFSIRSGKQIIDEVKSTVAHWNLYADKTNVPKSSRDAIMNVIRSLIGR